MQYDREKKPKMNNKNKQINERRKKFKKHASSAEEQSEICLSCSCSPSDLFLDLSVDFSQLQVFLSYF